MWVNGRVYIYKWERKNCRDRRKWTVVDDPSIEHYASEKEYVKNNWSADETKYENECVAVELKSPVLSKCKQSLDEVRRMVVYINAIFDAVVSNSTGFHVHVGKKDLGYSLATLQRFATLIVVYESRIETLHSPDRIDNTSCEPMFSTLKFIYRVRKGTRGEILF